ncbi:MAG: response regulator transcription factor [Alkalispirochaeta sp.]
MNKPQTLKNRLFIVEDNDLIRDAVSEFFQVNDYEVRAFSKGAGVLDAFEMTPPDVVILDIMLPDTNGYILAKQIRTISDVPLIFLTAKESESDRVMGFEVGGDDYVVKPFSTKELLLRTEAILRRAQPDETNPTEGSRRWQLGDDTLEIDHTARRVLVNDTEIRITSTEWDILSYLAIREDHAISREQILGECLGYHFSGSERTVDTHIANIRAALGNSGWIETVRGFGYRFSPGTVEYT